MEAGHFKIKKLFFYFGNEKMFNLAMLMSSSNSCSSSSARARFSCLRFTPVSLQKQVLNDSQRRHFLTLLYLPIY